MALSMSTRGDFEKNEDRDHKEVSCMVHARAPSNLAVPQKGHSFSLPWYRSVDAVTVYSQSLCFSPLKCVLIGQC